MPEVSGIFTTGYWLDGFRRYQMKSAVHTSLVRETFKPPRSLLNWFSKLQRLCKENSWNGSSTDYHSDERSAVTVMHYGPRNTLNSARIDGLAAMALLKLKKIWGTLKMMHRMIFSEEEFLHLSLTPPDSSTQCQKKNLLNRTNRPDWYIPVLNNVQSTWWSGVKLDFN